MEDKAQEINAGFVPQGGAFVKLIANFILKIRQICKSKVCESSQLTMNPMVSSLIMYPFGACILAALSPTHW